MMINKRLIGTVPDSKPYIAGNVALQWLSLLSNAGMIFSCAWFLQQLLEGAAAPARLHCRWPRGWQLSLCGAYAPQVRAG